jgi:hypothetical protein
VSFTILAGCGGFLLAVLWMDLMFDAAALRGREATLPEPVLAASAAYYRRVTTESGPMPMLIAAVMLATVTTPVLFLLRGGEPSWAGWLSLALGAPPIALAQARILPAARRLGAREGSAAEQSRRAREIARAHLFCLAAMAAFTALQLWLAAAQPE